MFCSQPQQLLYLKGLPWTFLICDWVDLPFFALITIDLEMWCSYYFAYDWRGNIYEIVYQWNNQPQNNNCYLVYLNNKRNVFTQQKQN